MDEANFILSRQSDLEAERSIEEPLWRDIAILFRPDDRDFDAHNQRRRDDTAIFDATQIYALDNFAGGLFSQMTNPMNKWFGLGIADKDLEAYAPVKKWLFRHTLKLLATFTDAVSPFYAEVPAWFSNLGAFGWAPMFDEELVGKAKIADRAIPIGESFIDVDAQGYVNTFHRKFSLKGAQARGMSDNAGTWSSDPVISRLDEKQRKVYIHCVWPNPGYVPGGKGQRGAQFLSAYGSPDVPDFYREGFYFEFPYQVPMWNRRSGRAYPTGPGHLARSDAAMLQEMARSEIVAAQFAAEPPVLVHDKSVITAADIEPNTVLYGTMNADNGKRVIDTLQRSQDFKLAREVFADRRNAIRQVFLFSIMQLLSRPEMTATEFLGFSKEFLQLAAPNLVRIQQGGLSPKIARRFRILERAGQIEPPPPELAGHAINVEYVSPLAKLMKVSEAQGVTQFLNAMAPVIQAQPETADNLDGDRIAVMLADGYVTDPSVLRNPDQVQQIRAGRAQAQQQAAKLQAAEQAANIGATVAHAQQAGTLAKKRAAA